MKDTLEELRIFYAEMARFAGACIVILTIGLCIIAYAPSL